MTRLRSTQLIGPVLGIALAASGCGGGSTDREPVWVTPGGEAGNGMAPNRADPPELTPGHPMTGSSAGPARPEDVQPSGGASPNPPPMPDRTPVTTAGLTPVDLLPGTRARVASWRLAGREGDRTLLLDVRVGGPPCDAVTDVDVQERAGTVRITVHTGVVVFEGCGAGVPARLGVARIRAHLDQPLGGRRLLGG